MPSWHATSSWHATLLDLGGFHELAAPPGPGSDAVPWARVLDEAALTGRFVTVRTALATGAGLPPEAVDPKVAVSATQIGLASRLWSVALAAVVLHRRVPDLSGANLVASPVHGGAVPLGLADPGAGYDVATLGEAVSVIGELVVDGSLAELDEACARVGRTPRQVLASNAASALVGAARVLARLRPHAATEAWTLARGLMGLDGVAQGGAVRDRGSLPAGVGGPMERPDEAFLRSGCCLFYRLPRHGLCPDCVLAPSRPAGVTAAH